MGREDRMRFWFSRTPNKAGRSTTRPYDVRKWRDIIQHDQALAAVAENLRPLGDKWVDEFARNYLAINDKKYTWSIVRKVIEDAKQEKEQSRG
jgi:hypothetical protein